MKTKQELVNFYETKYDPQFFEFDNLQMEIDPNEDLDDYNQYDNKRQHQEIIKCAQNFFYFAHKYTKALHPKHGLVKFIPYKYQRRVISDFESHRFNIISKFRQGGLTTVAVIWALWRCLFKFDQQFMVLSKTDREAIAAGEIVNRVVENLPNWLAPAKHSGKFNDHHKNFDTGSNLFFYTPEAARGRSITYLIIDEAAFVPDMDKHWKAIYPTIATGGNCIAISTVNGMGNWYQEYYTGAKDGKNMFHAIDIDYWEHPDYHDPEWVRVNKKQLGDKGWRQEVLREFVGTGNIFIDGDVLVELVKSTKDNYPKRKVFAQHVNKDSNLEEETSERGALWIWQEPIMGHEYIIGVDCSQGVGDKCDNGAFEIIDQVTMEQVGEFYSNIVPSHIFTQILYQIGTYYNNALLVIENASTGSAVLGQLENEFYYENIYRDNNKANPRPGLIVTKKNRSLLIDCLQRRLLSKTIKINSKRFVNELNTFLYNPRTQKAEAQRGSHDDAIMAMAIALYVRDSLVRDIPMGADMPEEIVAPFKSAAYEEIKKEILRGAPKDWLEEEETDNDIFSSKNEEILPGIILGFRRKHDSLLKEFSW